ncbi:MAG: rRNA maturation RNase YbeY [Spirochaetes bacterium]|nr:rRNA maturation RNase YbeY [Spirochaetota bacterium]
MDFNIYLKEENKNLPVSIKILKKLSSAAFSLTGKEAGDISLVVCDDQFISRLNTKYKGIEAPTDVLSFSMREEKTPQIGSNILGDIIISIDTARRQANAMGETLDEEFLILFIHGLLHLLGYTHNYQKDEKTMMEFTKKILSEVAQT